MLKVYNREKEISIAGDSETLKDEIGTLMLALCGEAAKRSKEAALDIYMNYFKILAGIAKFLETRHHIDVTKQLEDDLEEMEAKEPETPPTISKDLDDAIETFFSALDNIIAKKKGDK